MLIIINYIILSVLKNPIKEMSIKKGRQNSATL